MTHHIHHLEIFSDKPKVTRRFYSDLLGWNFPEFGNGYHFLEHGAINPSGGVRPVEADQTGVVFFVATDDVQGTVDKALALGAVLVDGPTEVPGVTTFAILQDPLGQRFGVSTITA